MLIFTNRKLQAAGDASALTAEFQPGSDALGAVRVQRDATGFAVGDARPAMGDDDALQLLVPLFRADRPVLLYLHGNNNPPAACFERCARLGEIYDLEVIGFSWPSEGLLSSGQDLPNMPPSLADGTDADGSLAGIDAGNRKEAWAERKIRRYRQAKVNAQDSGDALSRFLRLLAAARLYANRQRLSIAAHSLGCHFMQYAIENEGAAESMAAAHNIALLAACCRAEGHAGWVRRLTPRGQVFVTYNKADLVLFGAQVADGGQVKLGAEPGARIVDPRVRYVSFTNARLDFGGHGYFVAKAGDKPPKAARKVFRRIFGSERDIHEDQGEYPRKVYPVGCDADGSTCYMAAPSQ